MSNLGLRRALVRHRADRDAGGDRNVLEPSGATSPSAASSPAMINTRHSTTGDGTLTGILLLDTMVRRGRTLSELALGDDAGAAGAPQRHGRRSGRSQQDAALEPRPRRGRRPRRRRSRSCARRAPSPWCVMAEAATEADARGGGHAAGRAGRARGALVGAGDVVVSRPKCGIVGVVRRRADRPPPDPGDLLRAVDDAGIGTRRAARSSTAWPLAAAPLRASTPCSAARPVCTSCSPHPSWPTP